MLHELFWIKFNLDLKLRMLQWVRVNGQLKAVDSV